MTRSATAQATDTTKPVGETPAPSINVRWDTSGLKSSYVNVCNVTSTREEVVLNFGTNQNWERDQRDLEIQFAHRVILSPFAAKRLMRMLNNLVSEYESRYGELTVEGQGGELKGSSTSSESSSQ